MTIHTLCLRAQLLVFFTSLICNAATGQPNLKELQRKADLVLAVDNPEARPDIDVVFAAANAFDAAGQLNIADRYYAGGLKIESHDFTQHLAYAKLLDKEHKQTEKTREAQIVVKACEDAQLVAQAQALLGMPAVEITPFDPDKTGASAPTIVLVPIGDTDTYLLQQERYKLHDELGIDIQIHSLPLQMPKPASNTRHSTAETMRSQLIQLRDKDSGKFSKMLKAAGMSEKDLDDDAKVLRLVSAMFKHAGRIQESRNMDSLAVRGEDQWSAEGLLADLMAGVPPTTSQMVRFIGVTREDIAGAKTNYLYGWTTKGAGVVSYKRFTANFNNEIPDRNRLLRRFHFQCLSSAGRVLGIGPCTDPTCPRCFPNNLAEQDSKSDKLCDACREAFAKALK